MDLLITNHDTFIVKNLYIIPIIIQTQIRFLFMIYPTIWSTQVRSMFINNITLPLMKMKQEIARLEGSHQ